MKPERDNALDWVKGFLVEIMILFHCTEYCLGPGYPVLRYIDFVTGSFVLLAGFVVSYLYLAKYRGETGAMCLRLWTRGLKLVALFTVLNVITHSLVKRNYNGVELGLDAFFANAFAVYLPGCKAIGVFEILLPIAYTLIVAAALFLVLRHRAVVAAVVVLLFVFCTVLGEAAPFNLEFLSLGLTGVVLGYLRPQDLAALSRPRWKRVLFLLTACYFITVFFVKKDALLYLFGILVVNGSVYALARGFDYSRWIHRATVLFGQYSLLSYLSQIIFLQLLLRWVRVTSPKPLYAIAAVIAVNGLVYAFCRITETLRRRSELVNRAYRAVFA